MNFSKLLIGLLCLHSTLSFGALFNPSDCHPYIKKSCVLFKYYNDARWWSRVNNKFSIDYAGLKSYYEQVTEGLILENPEKFELLDEQYNPLANQDKSHLTFTVDYDLMVIRPNQNISPETAQQLFIFNNSKFNGKMGKSTFLESKMKYYNETRFDSGALKFVRDIMLLSDWKSLIHPPIRKIEDAQILTDNSSSTFRTKDYHMTMDALTTTELTYGNKLDLIVNNASYKEKIRLVKESKKFVFLAVMSFAPSSESNKLIDALTGQVKKGVDVRVILEGLWTNLIYKKTVKRLRAGGVKVVLSDDMLRIGRNQSLFHSKYMVIDGVVGIMGGQNLVDREHLATGYNHFNKDTDVKIVGPTVTDMMEDYIRLWERFSRTQVETEYKKYVLEQKEKQRKENVRGSENYQTWLDGSTPQGMCRFISQGPHYDKYKISRAYYETFSRLEKQLFYGSQHIGFQKKVFRKEKWSTKIYKKLFEKAESGLPITLVTNGIDSGILKLYAPRTEVFKNFFTTKINDISGYLYAAIRRNKLEYVSRINNFNIWQHFQYIHSKIALVDDELAAIGSYNFETYSAEHSYETAVFCQDAKLVNELKNDFQLDMANSTPLVLDYLD
jgi:phosphatidylserine/phosphatidylglycerophosphate/cardiolipin synthase-like enzyme